MRRVALAIAAVAAAACSSAKTTPGPAAVSADASSKADEVALSTASEPSVWLPATVATTIPHGHPITSLAMSPTGTAAVTVDQAQRIRIWPRLDGTVEPIDPAQEAVSDVALARTGDNLIVSTLDVVGAVRISKVGADRKVSVLYNSGPTSPALDVAVLPSTGATAILASDRSITIRGADGMPLARYDHRGFKPVRLYVAGPRLLGALEADLGGGDVKLTLHVLQLTRSGEVTTVERVGKPQELVVSGSIADLASSALGPGAKRFAVGIVDPAKNDSQVVIFDLADGTRKSVSFGVTSNPAATRLGFIDANHVVASLGVGVGTWTIDARTGGSVALPAWSNPSQSGPIIGHGAIINIFGVGLHVYDTAARSARFLTYRSFFPGQGTMSPSGTKFLYHSGNDMFLFDSEKKQLRTRKWKDESFLLRQTAFIDEDTLLIISTYGGLRLVDRESGEVVAKVASAGGLVRADYDPLGQRLLLQPRYGELWVFEIADRAIKGPFIVNDGATRFGFMSGDSALWTVDGANVIRSYTIGELREGVSRQSSVGRGKRMNNVYPLALTRSGDVLFSFHKGTQHLGRIATKTPGEFGAASFDASGTPLESTRLVNVDLKEKFDSTPIATSQVFVSPDGRSLAVASAATLNIYDAKSFELRWSYPTPQSVQQVSWDSRSQTVGVQSGSGIAFFRVADGELAHLSCGPIFVASEDEPPPSISPFAGSICTAAE